jgi:hypothetical protein
LPKLKAGQAGAAGLRTCCNWPSAPKGNTREQTAAEDLAASIEHGDDKVLFGCHRLCLPVHRGNRCAAASRRCCGGRIDGQRYISYRPLVRLKAVALCTPGLAQFITWQRRATEGRLRIVGCWLWLLAVGCVHASTPSLPLHCSRRRAHNLTIARTGSPRTESIYATIERTAHPWLSPN